jgi:hypothetical protein
MPPGFVLEQAHPNNVLIRRPPAASGTPAADFLSVELLKWPDDSGSVQWPPRLGSDATCVIHCVSVDSAEVHAGQLAGFPAHIETGLLNGGMPGWSRTPGIKAGWIVSPTRRGLAQGWASTGTVLDTLRAVIGTVQVAR